MISTPTVPLFKAVPAESMRNRQSKKKKKNRLTTFCSITQHNSRRLTWVTSPPVLECLQMKCVVLLIGRAPSTSSSRRPTWRWLSAHTPGGSSLWRRSPSAQVSEFSLPHSGHSAGLKSRSKGDGWGCLLFRNTFLCPAGAERSSISVGFSLKLVLKLLLCSLWRLFDTTVLKIDTFFVNTWNTASC